MNNHIAKHLYALFSFSFIIAFVFIAFLVKDGYSSSVDFKAFMTGAHLLVTNPNSLYDLQAQASKQVEISEKAVRFLPFKNPPIIAVLFLPFLLINYTYAFFLATIVFFAAIYACSIYFLKFKGSPNYLMAFVFTAFFLPNLVAAFNTQPVFVLYLIFVLLYISLKKKRHFEAGLVSGLLFIKLQYLLVIPFIFLMIKKRTQYFKGLALSSAALILFSELLSGGFVLNYPKFLLIAETHLYDKEEIVGMVSLVAFLSNFMNSLHAYLVNFIFYLMIAVLYYKNHKLLNFDLKFFVIVSVGLIFGVHVFLHDLVILQIPILLLVFNRSRSNIIFLALVLLLPYLVVFLDIRSLLSIVLLLVMLLVLFRKNNLLNCFYKHY